MWIFFDKITTLIPDCSTGPNNIITCRVYESHPFIFCIWKETQHCKCRILHEILFTAPVCSYDVSKVLKSPKRKAFWGVWWDNNAPKNVFTEASCERSTMYNKFHFVHIYYWYIMNYLPYTSAKKWQKEIIRTRNRTQRYHVHRSCIIHRGEVISNVKGSVHVLFWNLNFRREWDRGEMGGNANFKTNSMEPLKSELNFTLFRVQVLNRTPSPAQRCTSNCMYAEPTLHKGQSCPILT